MTDLQYRRRGYGPCAGRTGRRLTSTTVLGTALLWGPALPGPASVSEPSLAFTHVTVIDVTNGTRHPEQAVVIVGNRIQAVGPADQVTVPANARVVDAQGKYLVPGLWDMHTHAVNGIDGVYYPLFLVHGVTGIRDAGSPVALDTLLQWRREILAGTRLGPPRQILSGPSIAETEEGAPCDRKTWHAEGRFQVCVTDSADARHVVDSLKAAGVDMIKARAVGKSMYFVVAAEARRIGIPFGGHAILDLSATEASDSGASIIDHVNATGLGWQGSCWGPEADAEECRQVADQFRRNGTWWTLTLTGAALFGYDGLSERAAAIVGRLCARAAAFWASSPKCDASPEPAASDTPGYLAAANQVDMPILAATDLTGEGIQVLVPGQSLHAELEMYVAEGLSPLAALQSATLNPARLLHATDSLGIVAPNHLADLVLLDGDPLADITQVAAIRAVVANGRYFDRAALDSVTAAIQAHVRASAQAAGEP